MRRNTGSMLLNVSTEMTGERVDRGCVIQPDQSLSMNFYVSQSGLLTLVARHAERRAG